MLNKDRIEEMKNGEIISEIGMIEDIASCHKNRLKECNAMLNNRELSYVEKEIIKEEAAHLIIQISMEEYSVLYLKNKRL